MILQLNNNFNCTLQISEDELKHLSVTDAQQYTFNSRKFLEDVLNINFNKYRNFMIQVYPDQRLSFVSPQYLPNEYASLQACDIFPKRWKCEATLPFLYQTGLSYEVMNRFYNTLLLLKTNEFSKHCVDCLCQDLPFVYRAEPQQAPFLSSVQMMLYDLKNSLEENHPMHSALIDLLEYITDKSYLDDLLQMSTRLEFQEFCEKLNLVDFSVMNSQKLKTIYLCLSNPLLNKWFRDENHKFQQVMTPASKKHTGHITEVPASLFLSPSFNDRFKCEHYLRELYNSYRQKNEYSINPGNVQGLIALIARHALKGAGVLRKCAFCNSYSFSLPKKSVCNVCESEFSKFLNEEKTKHSARRGNLNRFEYSYSPIPHLLTKLYKELHPAINQRLVNLARDRIREKSFHRLKPAHLSRLDCRLPRQLRSDFHAQNDAENALLQFEKDASYKYGQLSELWKAYMVPRNFREQLIITDKDANPPSVAVNVKNLERMADAFAPFFDITTCKAYEQLAKKYNLQHKNGKP